MVLALTQVCPWAGKNRSAEARPNLNTTFGLRELEHLESRFKVGDVEGCPAEPLLGYNPDDTVVR